MKKCNFLQNGFTTETTAKGRSKLKKRRKGQFQQSYIWASSIQKSSPKPADKITAGNYEGEDLTYNTSWRKCQEVKEVSTKAAEKAFELVIPFLEEWKENNPQSAVEFVVDNNK